MNIYLFVIVATSLLAIIFWYLFFKKNTNKEGFFILLYMLFSAIWMIFYYIYFSSIDDPVILTSLSKVWYWSWIPCVFSFLFFVKFFQVNDSKLFDRETWIIIFSYIGLMFLYCYTDLIIAWVIYDPELWIFREVFWSLYSITYLLYGIFLAAIWYVTKRRLWFLDSLQKKRLINIVFSTFILVASLVFLQLVLPLFWIWVFEKQIILIYLVYIIYIYRTFKRYYFSSLFYWFGKILSFLLAVLTSIFALNTIKIVLLKIQSGNLHNYWNLSDSYSIIDSLLVILFFNILYKFFLKIFLGDSWVGKIKNAIQKAQKKISHITDTIKLNHTIQEEIRNIFKTKIARITFFNEKNIHPLQSYFQKNKKNDIFINDVVFMDENFSNQDLLSIKDELTSDMFLLLPIYNSSNVCIAMLNIWSKILWDFYTKDEIILLKEFTFFLEIHLKYIRTYTDMIDLSENLDNKVDQKTIEYNDLINKQKEFISMISHEIRSPIWSTIFQIDSLIDDIDKDKLSISDIKNNIKNIGDQLVNIGELLKKLFSIQYFDTRDVVLLKEKVQIWSLLEKEFEIYSRMYEDISFVKNISPHIWFINIDKIHFQQVITNLLENAIKFANTTDPVVLIECSIYNWNILFINIEDNGIGYGDIDPSIIFEKYSKWSHTKLWLWMWLYLCKRIVTMHGWTIIAKHGKILNGASFVIELPI